jgi:tRNA-specific 2-thiouridylase
MTSGRTKTVVALSGGVDSSVAAVLLKEQGHDVIGVTMALAGDAPVDAARRVAAHLSIPFHVVDFRAAFRTLVMEPFAAVYLAGKTPNPCALCNPRVKFGLLMDKARELGADYLATGHYARCAADAQGRYHLRRGIDATKDQSYFLFALNQEQLAHVLFPLGERTKSEVRVLAQHYGLPLADKGESQEICFIPDNDYAAFIEHACCRGSQPGSIVDTSGHVLGQHQGFYRYTIGQRKGLGLSHPTPLFVLRLDAARHEVVVGDEAELYSSAASAERVSWVVARPSFPFSASCKLRYRQAPVLCSVALRADEGVDLTFAAPQRAITPGQAVVFYADDEVLGGGWIR